MNTACREWTKYRDRDGYGRSGARGASSRLAHRVVWEEKRGPIPAGLEVDHLCGNRACVNVEHLELVTRAENVARSRAPSMINKAKTHCVNGHPFDEKNTYRRRNGGRDCRACGIQRTRKYLARKAIA